LENLKITVIFNGPGHSLEKLKITAIFNGPGHSLENLKITEIFNGPGDSLENLKITVIQYNTIQYKTVMHYSTVADIIRVYNRLASAVQYSRLTRFFAIIVNEYSQPRFLIRFGFNSIQFAYKGIRFAIFSVQVRALRSYLLILEFYNIMYTSS
jgi:hypothetical protein